MINFLAVVLCAAGFVMAGRCMLRNFDPERVTARNVVGHLAAVVPLQIAAGLCFTYANTSDGASLGYTLKLSLSIAPSLVAFGAFICIVPALFAVRERGVERASDAEILRMYRPSQDRAWSVKPTDRQAASLRSGKPAAEPVPAKPESASERVPIAV